MKIEIFARSIDGGLTALETEVNAYMKGKNVKQVLQSIAKNEDDRTIIVMTVVTEP